MQSRRRGKIPAWHAGCNMQLEKRYCNDRVPQTSPQHGRWRFVHEGLRPAMLPRDATGHFRLE
jgi:hypothetical protein